MAVPSAFWVETATLRLVRVTGRTLIQSEMSPLSSRVRLSPFRVTSLLAPPETGVTSPLMRSTRKVPVSAAPLWAVSCTLWTVSPEVVLSPFRVMFPCATRRLQLRGMAVVGLEAYVPDVPIRMSAFLS